MTIDIARTILIRNAKDLQDGSTIKEAIATLITEYQSMCAKLQALEQRNKMITAENNDLKQEMGSGRKKLTSMTTFECINYATDILDFIGKNLDDGGMETLLDIIASELHDRKNKDIK